MKVLIVRVVIVSKRRIVSDKHFSEVVYSRMIAKNLKSTIRFNFPAAKKSQLAKNLIIRSATNFSEMLEASTR